ncbi:MAG: DHA2 family efflux MFS transporter permease subunit [Bryobacteraceae bacterium]
MASRSVILTAHIRFTIEDRQLSHYNITTSTRIDFDEWPRPVVDFYIDLGLRGPAPSLPRVPFNDLRLMSSAALTIEQDVWRPKYNPWLIAVVVALAAFMEVLDTSIANVALPYMAGNLGASNDQSTWVLTSYLVSNAIILPISGWLAGAWGRKRFFMACLGIFTVSSLLCGIAPSLGFLLFFRVLQGAGGGGLQPMAQAILADTFPPQQRGLAFALYGITAIMAPTIGPTLGGWITFNYSWRWIFFINLPVGVATWFLVRRFVDDPPYLDRLKAAGVKLDYIGIALLTLGIGALQVLLDKGQEDDWFGSRFITMLVVVATVCLISLVIWESLQKAPIIDVRMFKNLNFASSSLMMFALGILLFSSLVLMPQFLETLLGYTSELAGFALSAGGLVLLLEMPIIGQLTTKFQARYLVAFGWLALSVAMFYSTKRIDLQMSFSAAVWLRIAQVIGLGFLFVPITLAAYIGISPDKNNSVAGIINFMRNMGSSVGTSLVTTSIARRSQFHQARLVEYVRVDNPSFLNSADALTQRLASSGLGKHDAQLQAYARIYQSVQAQAASLAYIDTFMVLGVGAAVMFCLAFLLKKNDPGGGGVRIAE